MQPSFLSKQALSQLGSALPHTYLLPLGPRAASSHSASVGRRLFSHLQNASACEKVTQLIGWSASPRFALQRGFHVWAVSASASSTAFAPVQALALMHAR